MLQNSLKNHCKAITSNVRQIESPFFYSRFFFFLAQTSFFLIQFYNTFKHIQNIYKKEKKQLVSILYIIYVHLAIHIYIHTHYIKKERERENHAIKA